MDKLLRPIKPLMFGLVVAFVVLEACTPAAQPVTPAIPAPATLVIDMRSGWGTILLEAYPLILG